MPVFASTDQVYAVAEELFARMQQRHPETIQPLQKSRLIVKLTTSDPAGEILVNARYNPIRTAVGPTTVQPELEIIVGADDLHRILLGKLGLFKAVTSGSVRVRGAVFKTAALGPLFQRGQDVYPGILRDLNIGY